MSVKISDLIKENEGFRAKVYQCTEGKNTVGYGTNLDDRGITREEAEYLLDNDLKSIGDFLEKEGLLNGLSPARSAVLYDMTYQMGKGGLLKFRNMLAAVAAGDFQQAAEELLNSRYAQQTPGRANRNADIMRTGEML